MRDKRPVDELSIEELERILAIRKRELRLERAERYAGRRVQVPPAIVSSPELASAPAHNTERTRDESKTRF